MTVDVSKLALYTALVNDQNIDISKLALYAALGPPPPINVTGSIGTITVSAITGDVVSSVNAAGSIGTLTLSTVLGDAAVEVIASGSIGTITFSPISGDAQVEIVASGNIGTITLSPISGNAITNVFVSGGIGTITLSPISGAATAPVSVAGLIGTVTLTGVLGDASVGVIVNARVSQLGLNTIITVETEPYVSQLGLLAVAEVDTQPRVTQMGLLVIASTGTTPPQPSFLNLTDRGREELLHLRTLNMYAERTPDGPADWAMFPRPGLKYLDARGSGPVRALFSWIGFRVIVSGANVYINGSFVGTVPVDGFVFHAVSNDYVVLNIGKRVYIVDLSGVVLAENALLRNVRGVAFLAGRFVYIEDDNSGIYRFSALNDPNTLDGLEFASAEANPDPIDSVVTYNGQLVFFNQRSVEWHFPTNNPNTPFQRSQGRTYDKGSISPKGTTLVNNILFFPGEDKVIYRAAESPVPVSDTSVGKALTKLTTEQMTEITGYQAYYDQHFWYVLNLPGQGTWAFDTTTNRWSEWKSHLKNRFQVSCADGEIYGDYESSNLYQFEGRTYEDNTLPMERVISSWLPMRSGRVRHFNLILMCQKAVGKITGRSIAPVVEMRFSDDLGKSWSIWSEHPLAPMGETGKEWTAEWTGLGQVSPPGRCFEFRCSDPVNFIPYRVKYNEVQSR